MNPRHAAFWHATLDSRRALTLVLRPLDAADQYRSKSTNSPPIRRHLVVYGDLYRKIPRRTRKICPRTADYITEDLPKRTVTAEDIIINEKKEKGINRTSTRSSLCQQDVPLLSFSLSLRIPLCFSHVDGHVSFAFPVPCSGIRIPFGRFEGCGVSSPWTTLDTAVLASCLRRFHADGNKHSATTSLAS